MTPENSPALATAILDLYQHPEKVKTLGYNSRQFAVEQYAFEQALTNYESLFYSLTTSAQPIDSSIVSKQQI